MEQIIIGQQYEFYCEVQEEYLEPCERLRNHTGQKVTVIEILDWEDGSSRAYKVRAQDGKTFVANEEELNGWDKELGQYFWPDGTYGPEHDETFLVNER